MRARGDPRMKISVRVSHNILRRHVVRKRAKLTGRRITGGLRRENE